MNGGRCIDCRLVREGAFSREGGPLERSGSGIPVSGGRIGGSPSPNSDGSEGGALVAGGGGGGDEGSAW